MYNETYVFTIIHFNCLHMLKKAKKKKILLKCDVFEDVHYSSDKYFKSTFLLKRDAALCSYSITMYYSYCNTNDCKSQFTFHMVK